MAGSSQQQQQLFSSLPATPSRTSTVGLPSNLRLSTPAHLAGVKAFTMFPGIAQLPGSPARTPKAATAAMYQLASASGFATQPGAGILGSMQPGSPACSVYQTPSAPDADACFGGATGQPATRKVAQAACTQTSPPYDSSSTAAAQQPHQPSPWTEWWRGLESGVADPGHVHSPAVKPRVLFCQEDSAAAASSSPVPAEKSVAEDDAALSPASFPFGCRSAAKAASNTNKGQQQQAQASPGGREQGARSLSPISLAGDDADLAHVNDAGCIAPSPAWSVHTNWAAVGHEEDAAAAGGLRSMAEAVEAAAAAGASISPDSCSGSSLKTSYAGTGLGEASADNRATQERLPLQAVSSNPHAQPQPAAALTPGISSIAGLEDMNPAEALAALSQLAHKLKARMDQAATAGLGGGMAPVISRSDLGMIVPSPIASRGGSAVGRWQQGAFNDEQ